MPSSKLQHYLVEYQHSEEFHRLKQEIFTYGSYYFETEVAQPYIIDAGAHIGLSTLYFKKLYPFAQVVAFEPLPQNYKLLEKNIWENQLDDVTTHQLALSDGSGTQTMFFDVSGEDWWSTAGFIKGAWTESQESGSLEVSTTPLAPFLDREVDFLKMDIEGAEYQTLKAAQDRLQVIKRMVIEFHPHADQSLEGLLKLLQDRGFTTQLWKKGKTVSLGQAYGLVLVEAIRK